MNLFTPREIELLRTVARRKGQGLNIDEQYAKLNAARDRRKKRNEKRVKQALAGGWANIPIIRAIILLALLCFSVPAKASPRHWFKDAKWWAGEAVIVTAVALDANSSCRAVARGGVEQNMILGPHPSCRQISAFAVGAGAYWTVFHGLDWHFWHDDPKQGWRTFGYTAIPVAAAAVHGSATAQNYGIPPAAVREGLVRP